MKEIFHRKKDDANFDQANQVCWDVNISKSKKAFSAAKALYIEDFFTHMKEDLDGLKYITDRERWYAVKVFCAWVNGNGIELGEYSWVLEKARTLTIAKWMGFSLGFTRALEEYNGEEPDYDADDY